MKFKFKISKTLILLTLFSSALFGCAICSFGITPQTQVLINVNADDKKIKTANITWVLAKDFSDQLKQIYDLNQDGKIDKKELQPIEKGIVAYVKEKNYLVHISYDKGIDKENSKKVNIKSKKAYMENSLLHFNYVLDLNYDVVKDNSLYINIVDDEEYFALSLAKEGISFNAPFKHQQILDKNSAIFYLNSEISKENLIQLLSSQNSVEKQTKVEKKELVSKKEEIKEEVKDENLLTSFSGKVKEYLVKIDQGDNYALFVLLGISFLYGIIHALGPGHGKSLAFSYFASNKSSFIKAFWVSQASAFIHIVGAFILVMISIFVLESMLNNFVNDSVEILTKVSAVMIMLLAGYILYRKINKKGCGCSSCCSHEEKPKTSTWSVRKPKNTTSLKPNFMKKDLYFVLTAGLIPCPGTVVLFIYAFILKTYLAVILAAIFISLGMGLVIFGSSFLGVSVHKLSNRSHKLTNALEILAPIVMFILGLLLFLNAEIL